MPLGLPNHLALLNVSRAYARAAHAAALVCLGAAFLIALVLQTNSPDLILWPAIVALVPMLVLLVLLTRRRRSLVFSVGYLVVGAVSIYWYALTGTFELDALGRSDSFVLALPKVALIMIGTGSSALSVAGWALGGFLVGEGAVAVASTQAGGTFVLDGTTVATVGLTLLILSFVALNRQVTSTAQSSVTRAARDQQISDLRYGIEARAAAVMHDTVLNHLAAIANAPAGPLPLDLRAQVTRDLEVLIGEEWLLDEAHTPSAEGATEWRDTALFAAIAEVRALGLLVDVSGDVSALNRLEASRALAAALAAKQCLVNVLRHSGVDTAEVAVYGSEREVSVMVIDSGAGFSEAATAADRLGLRQSVRTRIELVGGTVQVWSTPGRGTSVLISVPVEVGVVLTVPEPPVDQDGAEPS